MSEQTKGWAIKWTDGVMLAFGLTEEKAWLNFLAWQYAQINISECELKRWKAYQQTQGYRAIEVTIAPKDAEVGGEPRVDSIVRRNLMNERGYTPYCGIAHCRFGMPRSRWNGQQFECKCGWLSDFGPEFLAAYKAKWHAHRRGGSTSAGQRYG